MALSEKLVEIKSETDALIAYANNTTGEADTRLGDAVQTLVEGFGGGEAMETWTRLGDVSATADDNTNELIISGNFTQYKKFRVLFECQAAGTGNATISINNLVSSSYKISPYLNQVYNVYDAIIDFDEQMQAVRFRGFANGATWAQNRVFAEEWTVAEIVGGYQQILTQNPSVIAAWENLNSFKVWKYNTTYVKARFQLWGAK